MKLLFALCLLATWHLSLQGVVKPKASGDKMVICFFSSWADYRTGDGEFDPGDIDPFLCTHLLYAFAGVDNETYKIISLDPYNDLPDNYGKGTYLQFTNLDQQNPDLKTILAVGGANEGGAKFSAMAATADNRQTFVDSALGFMHEYGFDGIEIDWEYPTMNGGIPDDKANFVQLLKDLKTAFEPEGLTVSASFSAGESTIDAAYDVPNLVQYVDFFSIMTYDYHGTWESYTGHNAPLAASPEETGGNATLNVETSINYWLSKGALAAKMAVGLATYGHNFELADPQQHGFYAPTLGPGDPGPYTQQPGTVGYNEICGDLASWTVTFDDSYKAPYAFLNAQWVGYDDEESIRDKVDFANSVGLGGVMVWSLETDDFHGYCSNGTKFPLINAAKDQLQRSVSGKRKHH